jgi:hypothetical protein
MSTWHDDMKKNNPELAKHYSVVGNQSTDDLRRMKKALNTFGGFMNTEEDNKRLESVNYILKHKNKESKDPIYKNQNKNKS